MNSWTSIVVTTIPACASIIVAVIAVIGSSRAKKLTLPPASEAFEQSGLARRVQELERKIEDLLERLNEAELKAERAEDMVRIAQMYTRECEEREANLRRWVGELEGRIQQSQGDHHGEATP